MSDQDIFNTDNTDKNKDTDDLTKDKGTTDNQDENPKDKLLSSIVNENGEQKYKTEEEALKALVHAQQHIAKLEAEHKVLKEKGDASDKLEELMRAVNKSKESGQGDDNTSTIGPDDVTRIVQDYLENTKLEENRTNNINQVTGIFKNLYGKDASEKLYNKANDLGFNRAEINQLIATNPKAALNILGIKKEDRKIDGVTTPSSIDTSPFRDKPVPKPVSVMDISSSKDLTEAWRASKQKTNKRLGIDN